MNPSIRLSFFAVSLTLIAIASPGQSRAEVITFSAPLVNPVFSRSTLQSDPTLGPFVYRNLTFASCTNDCITPEYGATEDKIDPLQMTAQSDPTLAQNNTGTTTFTLDSVYLQAPVDLQQPDITAVTMTVEGLGGFVPSGLFTFSDASITVDPNGPPTLFAPGWSGLRERCLKGPSRSCRGEGNRQYSARPEGVLDLSGVWGGGTFRSC